MKPMKLTDAMKIAEVWQKMGGAPKVEIGALEPLLWRDGPNRIDSLVRAFVSEGYKVSMTTNGQLLSEFADSLCKAGLSLIRTSWHSTDPVVFNEISGGHGDYRKFMAGIIRSLDLGLKVDFNRVLLKDYTSDIPEQLDFLDQHSSRIKLFTLLWTPNAEHSYPDKYQAWQPIVRQYVLPKTTRIEGINKGVGRKRIRYHLLNGGRVEVKLGDIVDRSSAPCSGCDHKAQCEEAFGDYVRIDPRMHLYFCYLRRDIGFSLNSSIADPGLVAVSIQEQIGNMDLGQLLSKTALRLTVTGACNFNCRSPGESLGWCMEEPGEYNYPPIKPSLIQITR